jgi:RHS repeat-associated protein
MFGTVLWSISIGANQGGEKWRRMRRSKRLHRVARYYEPTSGRFLSADPMGQAASPSLYDFAGGDPVNFFDPDGRFGGTPLTAGEYFSAIGSGLLTGLGNIGNAAVTAPGRLVSTVGSGYQQIGGLAVDVANGSLYSDLSLMSSHPIDTAQVFVGVEANMAVQIGTNVMQQVRTSQGLANLSTDLALGLALGNVATQGTPLLGQNFGKLGTVVEDPGLNITGFTNEGFFRADTRGLTFDTMAGIVDSPGVVLQQSAGQYLFISEDGAVVLNPSGGVITTYPASLFNTNITDILNAAAADAMVSNLEAASIAVLNGAAPLTNSACPPQK